MLTEEQLELRRTGITATDCAALSGYSPHATASDVWLQKMGYATVEPSPDLERGTFDEPGQAKWYAHRTGAKLTFPGTMRHPEHEIVLATPDAIADGNRLVEIKSPRFQTGYQWGEPGTDDVPTHIRMQVMWQMAVTGFKRCDVAVRLFDDLAIFHVDYSDRLFEMLLDVAHDFWQRHVIERVPPEPDGSEGYKKYLKIMLPPERPELEDDNSPQVHEWVDAMARLDEERKTLNTERDKVRQEVMTYIGTRGGLRGDYGTLHYRQNRDSEVTDWKAIALELGADDDIKLKHTVSKPGARPLKAYPPRKKK